MESTCKVCGGNHLTGACTEENSQKHRGGEDAKPDIWDWDPKPDPADESERLSRMNKLREGLNPNYSWVGQIFDSADRYDAGHVDVALSRRVFKEEDMADEEKVTILKEVWPFLDNFCQELVRREFQKMKRGKLANDNPERN